MTIVICATKNIQLVPKGQKGPCLGQGACLLIEDRALGEYSCEIDPDYFTDEDICAGDDGIWCENCPKVCQCAGQANSFGWGNNCSKWNGCYVQENACTDGVSSKLNETELQHLEWSKNACTYQDLYQNGWTELSNKHCDYSLLGSKCFCETCASRTKRSWKKKKKSSESKRSWKKKKKSSENCDPAECNNCPDIVYNMTEAAKTCQDSDECSGIYQPYGSGRRNKGKWYLCQGNNFTNSSYGSKVFTPPPSSGDDDSRDGPERPPRKAEENNEAIVF